MMRKRGRRRREEGRRAMSKRIIHQPTSPSVECTHMNRKNAQPYFEHHHSDTPSVPTTGTQHSRMSSRHRCGEIKSAYVPSPVEHGYSAQNTSEPLTVRSTKKTMKFWMGTPPTALRTMSVDSGDNPLRGPSKDWSVDYIASHHQAPRPEKIFGTCTSIMKSYIHGACG